MISKEQLTQIKQQLFTQIDSTNIPNKEETKKHIDSMDEKQLVEFLKQNKLINDEKDLETQSQQKCIFCAIASEQVTSHKIEENEVAMAVLELNPVSKGHCLIIPKKHIETADKIPKTAFSLAENVAKRIKNKFDPKDITITTTNVMGHEVINVFPVYNEENIQSQKYKAEDKELAELFNLLEKKKETEKVKKPETKTLKAEEVKKLWLPKRIP